MSAISTMTLLWSMTIYQNPSGTEIFEVERHALQSRRSVRSGILTSREIIHQKGKLFQDRQRSFWFDGPRIRVDTVYHPEHGIEREIQGRNCPEIGSFTSYTRTRRDANGQRINTLDFRKMTPKDRADLNHVHDPRYFGMTPDGMGFWYIRTLDHIVARPQRRNATLSQGEWKGKTCLVVQYQGYNGPVTWDIRLWIVPEWGHSVVRIEKKYTEQFVLVDAVENEVALVGGTEIWFPTRTLSIRTIDGKEAEREDVTIDVKSLNQPVDPKMFRIEGMDIPPNTTVGGIPGDEKRLYYWDGQRVKKVEDVPEFLASLEEPEPVKPKGRSWWLVALAFGLGLASVLLFRRLFRAKPALS